jgi:hypothetical protein
VIEKVFGEFLVRENRLFIEVTDPLFWGDYSQNFDEVKFDWSLFELGGMVNFFVKNDDNKKVIFTIKVNDMETIYDSNPNVWFWVPISKPKEINQTLIKYKIEGGEEKILLDLNMEDGNNYDNIIKSVEYIINQ